MSETEAWIVSPCGDVRTTPGDKFIATVYGSGSQKHERALLIATAPKMLEMLKMIAESERRLGAGGSNTMIMAIDSLVAEAQGRVNAA